MLLKQLKNLNFTQSMLVALHDMIKGIGDIYDWQGKYNPKVGNDILEAYEMLKPYGWSFASEEEEKVLNGNHELFIKDN